MIIRKYFIAIFIGITMFSLCACSKSTKDIQLTVDNYEEYLDFSCSRKLTGAIDYGQAGGIGKNVGTDVYTAIETVATVKGKSSNYDYNDVEVTVRVTGYYIPYTNGTMGKINNNELKLEDYIEPIDITLKINTDITGGGSESNIINMPDGYWLMNESGEMNYEVVEVTGFMSK